MRICGLNPQDTDKRRQMSVQAAFTIATSLKDDGSLIPKSIKPYARGLRRVLVEALVA